MSPLFTVNFRREAYQREVARARRRIFALGVWVSYFGVIALLLGLYGLNCASLNRRLMLVQRQTARVRGSQGAVMDWNVKAAELNQVERYVQNPREWQVRLTRLSTILPTNVRLTSVAVNPQNLSTPADQNKLVISGQLRASQGVDRMQDVIKLLSTMRADSVFARSYKNIRLASTRVSEEGGGLAEFELECR